MLCGLWPDLPVTTDVTVAKNTPETTAKFVPMFILPCVSFYVLLHPTINI